jgi:hypothetical protein
MSFPHQADQLRTLGFRNLAELDLRRFWAKPHSNQEVSS